MGSVVKKVTDVMGKATDPFGSSLTKVNEKLLGNKAAGQLSWLTDPVGQSTRKFQEATGISDISSPDYQGAAEAASGLGNIVLAAANTTAGDNRDEEEKVELGSGSRRKTKRGVGSARASLMADQSPSQSAGSSGLRV